LPVRFILPFVASLDWSRFLWTGTAKTPSFFSVDEFLRGDATAVNQHRWMFSFSGWPTLSVLKGPRTG
jgi:hypothetical protein